MKGYRLSKVLADIGTPQGRAAFDDPALLRERYRLTPEEIEAVVNADLDGLFALGANPYLIRFAFRDKFAY
jgi:hypothetical protein